MIQALLRRTETWGEPTAWWGAAGLSMHPVLYGIGIFQIALSPVAIVAGWILITLFAGPIAATEWVRETLRVIPAAWHELWK